MPELYDVAVIGGGPSGCLVASSLASAGNRVVLLERRRAGVFEPSCTGIVGRPYLDTLPVAQDLVLRSARSAVLISPSGRRLHVSASTDQAFILDRRELERRLRQQATAAGARVVDGALATRVDVTHHGCTIRGRTASGEPVFLSRALVIAAGVAPGLLRQAHLAPPSRHMVGAHAEVEMDDVDQTEVYFLSDFAPGAFAWLVPVDERRVRLGVLSPSSAARLAERFLERPEVRRRLRQRPDRLSQRPVPVALSRHMFADRVLVVGDAAGQVKPTTGGGLYLGAMGAESAGRALCDALAKDDLSARALSGYDAEWRCAFGDELRRGGVARGVYSRLSARQVDGIIDMAERTHVAEKLLTSPSFSFDRHSGALLSGLLRCLPGVLWRPAAGRMEADA